MTNSEERDLLKKLDQLIEQVENIKLILDYPQNRICTGTSSAQWAIYGDGGSSGAPTRNTPWWY